MTDPACGLDHVVLNAKTDLEPLRQAVDDLGFRLSPRAVHSLGSMNHVAILASGYLELIGVPPERPEVRPEITEGTTGLDGLVLRTPDAEATRRALCDRGAMEATRWSGFARSLFFPGESRGPVAKRW